MFRLLALLAILLSLAGLSLSAQPCTDVVKQVAPCISFLTGKDADPSSGCCAGVKSLSGSTQAREDRTAVCECLKQALAKVGNYDADRMPALPGKCGVSVSLPPITKSTDCAKA